MITVVVFQGPVSNGKQFKHFSLVAKKFLGIASFIYITCNEVRRRRFTLAQFVAFMGSGHMYIFLSHPMQGKFIKIRRRLLRNNYMFISF
jgi:hypothetical protein